MSYYEQRRQCIILLRKTLAKAGRPVSFEALLLGVMEKYGFGRKILVEMLDLLIKAGDIRLNENNEYEAV